MSKSFKIPRLKPDDLFEVEIYRTGVIETRNGATLIKCKKQVIEGVTIPRGFEFWNSEGYIHNEFSANPTFMCRGWKLNEVLKHIVMEGLRNG